jgi:hypothetical protein
MLCVIKPIHIKDTDKTQTKSIIFPPVFRTLKSVYNYM